MLNHTWGDSYLGDSTFDGWPYLWAIEMYIFDMNRFINRPRLMA